MGAVLVGGRMVPDWAFGSDRERVLAALPLGRARTAYRVSEETGLDMRRVCFLFEELVKANEVAWLDVRADCVIRRAYKGEVP
jgi:hypothetical protein